MKIFKGRPPLLPIAMTGTDPGPVLDRIAAVLKDHSSYGTEGTILFSGGLDSSLLAWAIPGADLLVIGADGSKDVQAAVHAADGFQRELTVLDLTENAVRSALSRLVNEFQVESTLQAIYMTPFLIAAETTDASYLITGQGADELFCGYTKYYKEGRIPEYEYAKDLQKLEMEQTLYERIGLACGITFIMPFLDERMVEIAESIDLETRMREDRRKWMLRDLAKAIGLPATISERPKKAVQYGSGLMDLLRGITGDMPLHEFVMGMKVQ